MFTDISSIEKVSTELSSVKELFKEMEAIISSSYDGMFIADSKGVVLRVNTAYERITGIKASEVLGKNLKDLVAEGYYDQSVTLLVIEKREIVTINQTVKNNNKILVTGNPIFDEKGNLFRVVTNVRDITELVNLESQLLKTKEQTLKYKTELSHLRALHIQDKDIISRSHKMAQVIELATKIADVDSIVLINGESGTGKELVAKLIHKQGKGTSKPFIKINCAAIPEQLLESELFGYEGGAFTGARKEGKPGLFELANNGTLFLDEIGDLPLLLQVKLLRAIQEKEFIRVGGTKTITFTARIIAATHRNIAKMVKDGSFREDLYYRLMVVPIHLSPLRERKEDIPLLIMHFIDKFNHRFGYDKKIMPQVIDKLAEYSWPGNVRELENIVERMMVTAPGEEITMNLVPETILDKNFFPKRVTKLKDAVEQTEKYLLSENYKEYGSWQKVAEILGIDRTTVFRKIVKYELERR
jgi:PAS domain S-box-containing protein